MEIDVWTHCSDGFLDMQEDRSGALCEVLCAVSGSSVKRSGLNVVDSYSTYQDRESQVVGCKEVSRPNAGKSIRQLLQLI